MPSRTIVRTRKSGYCSEEFAHYGVIKPGDRVEVTTHLPGDEAVTTFGLAPFTRTRRCQWCLERDEAGTIQRLELRAAAFTTAHPIGTEVRYWPGVRYGVGRLSTIRTPAWVMPSGDIVISVEGYPGGIALTHIEPTASETPSQQGASA